MKPLRVLLLLLLGLFAASLILLLLCFQDAQSGTLEFEIAKALLEVGIVSVTGAVVTALVFEYQHQRREEENKREKNLQQLEKQRESARQEFEKQRDLARQQMEYRDGLLLSTLSKAMNAYSQAKKGRRFLRGKAIKIQDEEQEEVVIAEQYDKYLEIINDAQLKLENLARDVETSAKAFSDADAVKDNLWAMESYLNKIVGEYEDSRRQFLGGVLALDQLPYLEDFLASAKGSNFKPRFATPFHAVQKLIRQELLHPNLPQSNTIAEQVQ